MKQRNVIWTICLFSGLFYCGLASAAGAITSGKLPFAFPVDTCNETVELSGWFRTTFHILEDEGGGVHFISQLDAHGSGEGDLTGTSYRWNDSFEHAVENFTPGGRGSGNWIRRTNLISQGSMENSSFWLTAHYTITPDGDVVLERFDVTSECYL